MPNQVSLKSQLRFFLSLRGLSAAELARRAHVSKQSISLWQHGAIPKSITQLRRVADALNVSLDALCYGEDLESQADSQGTATSSVSEPHHEERASPAETQSSWEMFRILLADGTQRELSPCWETVTGWSLADLKNRQVLEFIHVADRQRAWLQITRNFQGIPTVNFDSRFLCKGGDIKWLRWNAIASLEQGHCYCIAKEVSHEYPPEYDFAHGTAIKTLIDEAIRTVHQTMQPPTIRFQVHAIAPSIHIECRPARMAMGILALFYKATSLAASSHAQALVDIKVQEDRQKLYIVLTIPGANTTPNLHLSTLVFHEHGGNVVISPHPSGTKLIASLSRT